MKRAIVTGATGFIGRALTKALLARGVQAIAVGRDEQKLNALQSLGADAFRVSYEDYGRLDEVIDARNVDVFYHCAFSGGFGGEALRDYSLQLDNAKRACDAVASALRMGVKKFVLASTVNTVELRGLIEDETAFPRYTCIYSAGKLAAEIMGKTLARNGNMAFSVARIAMPYGEGNPARTLPNIVMEQLSAGIRPRLIEGNDLYDLVYIADVAEGLLAMGESGLKDRDYYIGHRKLQTFRAWMTQMRDALSPATELGFGEYPGAPALDYGYIELDALYQDTGFECTADFKKSITKTAQWLETQKSCRGGYNTYYIVCVLPCPAERSCG